MAELPGNKLGRYEIIGLIGKGGVAKVYKARDLARGDMVALKILSPYLAEEPHFQERFRREVNVLKGLSHPNIVPIIEYGQHNGLTYLSMPFVPSGTLLDRMQRSPLSLREIALINSQVTSALSYAHQKGIVHRDVKPSNILLDGRGDAMLSDFGLAYVHDASQSLTGSVLIGTPAYMSPEQCRGEEVDARSDQYSLGIVLYQLTTGRLPFDSPTPMATVMKQITEPLPWPRDVNPQLPEAIEEVLVTALAKDPARRYASIREMNEAFQQSCLDGQASGPRTWVVRKRLAKHRQPLDLQAGRTTAVMARRASLVRTIAIFAVTLGLAVPIMAWAANVIENGGRGGNGVGTPTPTVNVMGTVYAYSTAISKPQGLAYLPAGYQTAVAGTVQAFMLANGTTPTGTPTGTLEIVPSRTATQPSGPYATSTSLPPGSTHIPASPTGTLTPSTGTPPVVTATSGPTATPRQDTQTPLPPTATTVPTAPSDTPDPTPAPTTAPPPPTVTPVPPGQCKKNPGLCTPVPTTPPPAATATPESPSSTSVPTSTP